MPFQKKVSIALFGFGKTGKIVSKEILLEKNARLLAVFKKKKDEEVGKDVGEILGVHDRSSSPLLLMDDFKEWVDDFSPDVVIDFSNPENLMKILPFLAKNKIKLVVCSTGYDKKQKERLRRYSKKMSIVWAPNITEGVNILLSVSKIINKIWSNADIEMIEIHHRDKKDISGTAKRMARIMEEDFCKKKKRKNIPIHSLRMGGVVGKHTIHFCTKDQSISITHESLHRNAFGKGAVTAAKWVRKKENGFYTMEDVLEISRFFSS